MQTARDVPLLIRSENASSERRITPSWSIAHLKVKLEPITGIPPSCQSIALRLPGQAEVGIEAPDEETAQIGYWKLEAYAELSVTDTRPPSARINLSNVASVPKYTMPAETYSTLADSVLAWKKTQKLGRFDPNAPEVERKKIEEAWDEVEARGIGIAKRCRLGADSARRGIIAFVGDVEEIPGLKGPWVGVVLDEPLGKNDGSVGGKRYFACEAKKGVFVRPDRVEVGEFGTLMDEDGDLEEI